MRTLSPELQGSTEGDRRAARGDAIETQAAPARPRGPSEAEVELRRALREDSAVDEYLRRAAGRDEWWVRPFDCGPGGCEDPQRPRLGRVTNAPVALLLGPGCKSACDTFSAIWSRERFGPMVGTPPAAMYTSLRYPLAVELDGEWLGDFTTALCGLRWEAGEPWLEGQPLTMDTVVEPNASILGNELGLIEGAIAALRAWPRPDAPAGVPSDLSRPSA